MEYRSFAPAECSEVAQLDDHVLGFGTAGSCPPHLGNFIMIFQYASQFQSPLANLKESSLNALKTRKSQVETGQFQEKTAQKRYFYKSNNPS